MLIEDFFRDATGRVGCADDGRKILESTAHLIKARSAAVGATKCVFLARLGESMGVRGFYHSVLPGKGVATHALLAVSFPVVFREFVESRDVDVDGIIEEYWRLLKSEGVIDTDRISEGTEEETLSLSKELAARGAEFAAEALVELAGDEGVLSWARALTEVSLMSYRLHIWGVTDVVVEDPVGRYAVIIEWKTYSPAPNRSPQIAAEDIAQAYVYAMLEAERLGLAGESFESYVSAVLGKWPTGLGARVVPAVVRPIKSARRIRNVIVRHPLFCDKYRDRNKYCDYDEAKNLMARIVLAAEHLTLSVTDMRSHIEEASNVEELCSVVTRTGKKIVVFRRSPVITLDDYRVILPIRYPSDEKENDRWPCNVCPDNVREACIYFLRSGFDPKYAIFEALRKESWRARFAIYQNREWILASYKYLRSLAMRYGSDFRWVKGSLRTRMLPDGSRLDLFDTAYIDGDEVVMERNPMRWEIEYRHLFTLREGKPATVILNEEQIRDPLLRLSFHGTVTRVGYDEETGKIVVTVAPANKLSRIYPIILKHIEEREPRLFSNVVAFETNVDLTQLELLGVTAAEMGTVRAAEKVLASEESGGAGLALLFGGISSNSENG